jgi:predicted dehydrogenase
MSTQTGNNNGHTRPLGIAVAGVGGYGGSIIDLIQNAGQHVPTPIRLVAAHEPFPERYSERVDALKRAGVALCGDLGELCVHDGVDAVWLPVPIHLHADYTGQVLALGRSVICEKPAAASLAEVDRMIDARDRSGKTVLVGFQEIYDPTTLRLKRLLCSGQLGKIKEIRVITAWPRTVSYFARNDWAGRVRYDGSVVDDSPLSNAMAHFVNLGLFFAGENEMGSATPVRVSAETYRVNQIENYDTVSLRAKLCTGATLMSMMTFACRQKIDPRILILCEKGRVERTLDTIIIDSEDGPRRQWAMKRRDRVPMLRCVSRVLSGMAFDDQAVATLEVARAHTALVESVSRATRARWITADDRSVDGDEDNPMWAIDGIEEAMLEAYGSGRLLSELGVYGWATSPGTNDNGDAVKSAMLEPVVRATAPRHVSGAAVSDRGRTKR